jgi:hypothetical protein
VDMFSQAIGPSGWKPLDGADGMPLLHPFGIEPTGPI